MESLVACVWSCDPAIALEYPARYLFAFLQHHGMLQIFGSPQWRTVTGGSREYVAKVAAHIPDVRTGTKVTLGARDAHRRRDHRRQRAGRDLRRGRRGDPSRAGPGDAGGPDHHAARGARGDAATRRTPPSCTPTPASCRERQRARASWNYLRRPSDNSRTVTVSYDMTRLMRLPVPTDGRRFIVTLGGQDDRRPGLGDRDAWSTSTRSTRRPPWRPSVAFPSATTTGSCSQGPTTAGASTRTAAVPASRRPASLGCRVVTRHPGLGRAHVDATTIRHTRRKPFTRTVVHQPRTWLVDLDHRRPRGPRRLRARDHLVTRTTTPGERRDVRAVIGLLPDAAS